MRKKAATNTCRCKLASLLFVRRSTADTRSAWIDASEQIRPVFKRGEGFPRIRPNPRRDQSPDLPSESAMAGAQCCENPPVLNPAFGEGSVVESFGGLKAYTVGSPNSKAAVVLVSDIFGYEAPNLRKLADKVAAAGFLVVVPDFLYGDPYVPDSEKTVMTWLEDHGTDKGFEDAKSVIQYLKSKGISLIGAAGFCWGGKVVTELAKTDYVNAVVMLHPSFVKLDDIYEIKRPTSILAAEHDSITPLEQIKQFEEILSTRTEVNSFVKIFPGVAHGWTVRYDTNDEAAVEKAGEAHKDLLDWFEKYLK